MKFRNVFVLKSWIVSSSIVSPTWHMHKTRESRQRRLKTRPGSSPGSRQDDKMEPIWSRFDAWRGTSWIDCKKNAGSLKTRFVSNDCALDLRFYWVANWVKKSLWPGNISTKIKGRVHLVSSFYFPARYQAQNLIPHNLKFKVHLFPRSESNRH